jgi:predicted dehydrogenase
MAQSDKSLDTIRNDQAVRVVLVGCGAVSQLFYGPTLEALSKTGKLRVVALVDPSLPAREKLRQSFPQALGASALADLPPGEARLAIIASPPKFHREQTEAAFAAGLDVLCEKPLASSSAEGEAMVAAATRTGRLFAAGHYKRFMPAHVALKHFIIQKTFGALLSVDMSEGGKFSWPAATDSFFRKEQTPGGVLLDIGVHVLDLLLWWLGEPSDFSYLDDAVDGLEANCRFTGVFAEGARVTLRLSRDWATPQCYAFRFERATVHCRVNASNQLELTFDGVPMTFAAELRDPLPGVPAPPTTALETNPQAFIAQLIDVCEAIRTGRPPSVPGSEGLRAIRLIEKCYARRQPLSQPWLGPVQP